ncbi:MAG: hypothetical protein V3R80_10100, partial [Candidatus Tectomicrobia bacterium]
MRRRHAACRIARWGFRLVLIATFWAFGPFTLGLESAREAVAQATQSPSTQVSATVMNGWRWFHVYCFRCHGTDALGSQI